METEREDKPFRGVYSNTNQYDTKCDAYTVHANQHEMLYLVQRIRHRGLVVTVALASLLTNRNGSDSNHTSGTVSDRYLSREGC